jgi:alpha/beta superfamily hydrolase
MTPFYFGEGTRRLFGAYDPAKGSGAARAVIICSPWGPDHVVAHAPLRRLAIKLADAGNHVLRFDYFGVGDSAGDIGEGELEGWREDTAMAIEEIKSIANIQRVCLVGLRLGATLAVDVAANRSDIDAVVLWDPVVRGEEFLAEMQAAHQAFLAERTRYRSFATTTVPNMVCYPLPPLVERQILHADLIAVAPKLRQKILLVITQDLVSHGVFIPRLMERGRATVERVADQPPWRPSDWETGASMPTEALRVISAWMAQP